MRETLQFHGAACPHSSLWIQMRNKDRKRGGDGERATQAVKTTQKCCRNWRSTWTFLSLQQEFVSNFHVILRGSESGGEEGWNLSSKLKQKTWILGRTKDPWGFQNSLPFGCIPKLPQLFCPQLLTGIFSPHSPHSQEFFMQLLLTHSSTATQDATWKEMERKPLAKQNWEILGDPCPVN